MRRTIFAAIALVFAATLTGCSVDETDRASLYLEKASDNLEVSRRIVFYNGVTGEYMLSIEGFCSKSNWSDRYLTITCRTGPGEYRRHTISLSDNMTYFIEQVEPFTSVPNHYVVNFKPAVIATEAPSH